MIPKEMVMNDKLLRNEDKMKSSQLLVTFLILFISFLALQVSAGIVKEEYVGDAWEYAEIGDSLFSSGHFRLNDITSPITVWGGGDYRGFVFPILLGSCQHLDAYFGIEAGHIWWVVSSILYAALFMVYLKFLKDIGIRKSEKYEIIRDFVPFILLLFFFYGLIIYTLTDLLASLLAILAAELLLVTMNATETKKKLVSCFVCGEICYLTYNVRTIYLLEFIGILLTIFFVESRQSTRLKIEQSELRIRRKWGMSFLCSGLLSVGFYTAAFPQVYLNFTRYRSISPLVRTNSLMSQQLWWGLGMSRYGTYVGNDGIHSAQMIFQDGTGMAIQNAFENAGEGISLSSYLQAFLTYPFDVISILWKHVWNAMFILFPETYVRDLTKNRSIYVILSLIIFIFFLFLLRNDLHLVCKKHLVNIERVLVIASLLLPTLAILPGAVEERFLLVFYLMVYGRLAYCRSDDIRVFCNSKRYTWCSILMALVIALTALTIESEILSSLQGVNEIVPLLINGKFT